METKNTFKKAVRPTKTDTEKPKKDNNVPCIIEIDKLCQILNIGKNTAYNLLTSGEIDSFKVGSVWKIPISSINEYIKRKCKEEKQIQLYKIVNMDRDLYFSKHNDLPLKYKPY